MGWWLGWLGWLGLAATQRGIPSCRRSQQLVRPSWLPWAISFVGTSCLRRPREFDLSDLRV